MSKRVIQITGPAPKDVKPFVILPMGLYCNRQLQRADAGTELDFADSWRIERRVLVRKCVVKVNSPVFTFMLRSLLPEWMSAKDLFRRWNAECEVAGLGRDAFSRDEVLLIEVKKRENE